MSNQTDALAINSKSDSLLAMTEYWMTRVICMSMPVNLAMQTMLCDGLTACLLNSCRFPCPSCIGNAGNKLNTKPRLPGLGYTLALLLVGT